MHFFLPTRPSINSFFVGLPGSLGHNGVRDKASIETARALLNRIKLHSDPVLRHYGWTVKHLQESVGGPGGMCFQ